MNRKKAIRNRVILTIIIIIALLAFGVFKYKSNINAVDLNDKNKISIEIPQGSSVSDIASILYKNDLIKNKNLFRFLAKKEGVDSDFKAGNFELSRSMDLYDIFHSLTNAGIVHSDISVTIPEGYELDNIAEKLANESDISKERFLDLANEKENFESEFEFLKDLEDGQSLEGFLFPATYEIDDNTNEEDIIINMLAAFDRIYKEEIIDALGDSSLNLNELVTLASIIEREARVESERSVMSGVFYNRMKEGMPLQSCATVQYIIGERKPVLSIEETQIDSPFNTYINKGLPPRPISSPGKDSIIAALYPEDVDYLFFVLTGEDGSHTFSKTYEEHLKAQENMIGR